MKLNKFFGLGALVLTAFAAQMPAATWSGTLTSESDHAQQSITVGANTTITATSTSYATGGFEPYLALFDPMGNFVAFSEFDMNGTADPGTGQSFDQFLSASNLGAGQYTLTISDFTNEPPPGSSNLSAGFVPLPGSGPGFVDEQGNVRTGDYSVTVSTAASTATPEPGSVFLTLAGLGSALVLFRKKSFAVRS